jgi:hypothetical protein
MIHLAARAHAFINGLFRPSDETLTRELYDRIAKQFAAVSLEDEDGRDRLADIIVADVLASFEEGRPDVDAVVYLVRRLFDYEQIFVLPEIDWTERRSVSQYWELRDELNRQRAWLDKFDECCDLIRLTLVRSVEMIRQASPELPFEGDASDGITVPTERLRAMREVPEVAETVLGIIFDEELEEHDLFTRHRKRFETNLIVASGGNPADPDAFKRAPKLPTKSDIRDPVELVATYLGGTPISDLFAGTLDFTIPNRTRFEHHHIVAGSGHGKTQTLQYLIAKDLAAVARGERSVIVLDSQGDLIRNIAGLKLFAPGEKLHDRIVIIDPTDVEYPVSLNLFDVGLDRLNQYSQLDRERLTNSILELYDFVLGTLLSAEMTQKQSVIFRYVTRLMLHIPDATIHTLRELMEPGSEVKFATHIEKLTGTARHFFESEFPSPEFTQTRRQVLRRLWGILENQTFERMFSHPRSKLDLFAEMNAGKVILINTAKDLLKEQGTEIFGRFFIALIAQAAQERATLAGKERMPTFVYVDEAADYFDRNIGLILSQARKFNVGMVLAHQYLGQLEPKLQEAFSANTSIKFAGGVSARDARTLAPQLYCEPSLIEAQPKGSFAAHVRGVTKSALPLKFPFGHMEAMDRMTEEEQDALRQTMRARYAVHYSEVGAAAVATETGEPVTEASRDDEAAPKSGGDVKDGDTEASSDW